MAIYDKPYAIFKMPPDVSTTQPARHEQRRSLSLRTRQTQLEGRTDTVLGWRLLLTCRSFSEHLIITLWQSKLSVGG